MTRLHALDAVWLEMEKGGPALAPGLLSVLDGPAPPVAQVRALVAERIERAPGLRWVLDEDSSVRRPQWRDAGMPDLRQHVRAVRIGADPDQLADLVSAFVEQPLDRSRPLWEALVVRGLAHGQWAFVWRLHHSVADGIASRAVMGHLMDTQPDGGPTLADAAVSGALPVTSGGYDRPTHLPGRIGRAIEGAVTAVASAIKHAPEAAHVVADVTPRPPGSLTGPLSGRRRWVFGTEDLALAKTAKKRHGASLNDVILAAVANGYRTLLVGRGEQTAERTLRCVIPVSLRPAVDDHADNRLSAAWTDLPVGDMAPGERVHAIGASTRWQIHAGTPMVGAALISLADHLVPGPVQEVVIEHATWVPEWFADTLVTNVPGIQVPLYVAGRRIEHMHPVIPVDGHLRITVGVVSHDGTLGFGVTGDGLYAADVDELLAGISTGLHDLAGT
ncbi:MAG: wax ester/triacylglycerol synthase domain-containing protein [Jiangellales bacterium]